MRAKDDQRPTLLGGFRIERELGRGAMGIVYRGRHPESGRLAAIKVLKTPVGAGERTLREHQERFFTEARAAGRLDHPNVVRVFDAGEDAATGAIWIAMELVEGQDLAGLIDEQLSLQRLSTIITELAAALDHAHSRGIIHRDVKPTNVLIDSAGRVRLSDFGVARLVGLSLTAPGTVLGSPAYMAPEQVRGDAVSPRTDIHALGVVLYEAVTGLCPFAAETEIALAEAIVSWAPDKAKLSAAGLSPEIEAIIEQALEKDPALRPESAGALAAAFASAVSELTGTKTDTPPGSPVGLKVPRLGPSRGFSAPPEETSASTLQANEPKSRLAPAGAALVLFAVACLSGWAALRLAPAPGQPSGLTEDSPQRDFPSPLTALGGTNTGTTPSPEQHSSPPSGTEASPAETPARVPAPTPGRTPQPKLEPAATTQTPSIARPSPSHLALGLARFVVATRHNGVLAVEVDGAEVFRADTRDLEKEERGISFLKRRASITLELPVGPHEFRLHFIGPDATVTTSSVAEVSLDEVLVGRIDVSLRTKRIRLSFD